MCELTEAPYSVIRNGNESSYFDAYYVTYPGNAIEKFPLRIVKCYWCVILASGETEIHSKGSL